MKKYTGAILLAFILAVFPLMAQETQEPSADEKTEELKGQLDGLNETVLEMKATVDALKKIKISGYLQAQYQSADSDAISSMTGGNFAKYTHNRFQVRRGRVKFTYDNDLTNYVIQLDCVPSGVTIKDAYAMVKEPWMRAFSLTAGVFDRPFGFEISYSSSMREAPERSRLFQTLFPGERDLGAKIEFAPENGPLSFLNAKVGLFAGNRGTIDETDNAKDVIGRIGVSLPFTEENLAVDAGVSGYFGKVRRDDGTQIYKIKSSTSVDSSADDYADRTYIGADLEVYYDLPVLGGFSVRGEFISGKQPGTSSSSGYHAVGSGAVYLRNFMGYYFTYVQNIGVRNQFVLKYDVYDPNTDISGDEINTSSVKLGASKISAFGAADIKYSTLGLGWIYHWDGNVKFTLYYDMVKNETTAKYGLYGKDLRDNVLTARMQYSF